MIANCFVPLTSFRNRRSPLIDEMEKLDLRDSDLRAVSDSDTKYKV